MTRARPSVDTTGPLTAKATGLIRLSARVADDEILEAALAERWGISKRQSFR